MADEISSSNEAAQAFKQTVNQLMDGLRPIVTRHDKNGWKVPDISSLIKSATGGANGGLSITKIFDDGLTPTQKFLFAQAWAKTMDEKMVLAKFIKDTKKQWSAIEDGSERDQEEATLRIVDGMSIPGNGAQFLRVLYDKKELLTKPEKSAVLEYFKTLIYYSQMYEELKADENKKLKDKKGKWEFHLYSDEMIESWESHRISRWYYSLSQRSSRNCRWARLLDQR